MITPKEYEQLFSTPLGKSVLDALVEQFYNNTEFESDALKLSFNAGRRNVIQFIKNQITTALMPQQQEEELDNE